ncbi:MAG: hypothetical protein K0U98_26875 [Deltaproteobacteria bacterium]|nr:hypothetical protein [Deltaproteobacteria bacterium]
MPRVSRSTRRRSKQNFYDFDYRVSLPLDAGHGPFVDLALGLVIDARGNPLALDTRDGVSRAWIAATWFPPFLL